MPLGLFPAHQRHLDLGSRLLFCCPAMKRCLTKRKPDSSREREKNCTATLCRCKYLAVLLNKRELEWQCKQSTYLHQADIYCPLMVKVGTAYQAGFVHSDWALEGKIFSLSLADWQCQCQCHVTVLDKGIYCTSIITISKKCQQFLTGMTVQTQSLHCHCTQPTLDDQWTGTGRQKGTSFLQVILGQLKRSNNDD